MIYHLGFLIGHETAMKSILNWHEHGFMDLQKEIKQKFLNNISKCVKFIWSRQKLYLFNDTWKNVKMGMMMMINPEGNKLHSYLLSSLFGKEKWGEFLTYFISTCN